MKKIYVLLFFSMLIQVFGQSKITVIQSETHTPISGASVSCKGKIIGKTDQKGFLEFSTKCKIVEVKATGFYEEEITVEPSMTISLTKEDPKTKSIEAVIINDKSDPKALAIIRKVNENYKENSPQSLDSYSFKSYEKISVDFDQDSIQLYESALNLKLDSLKKLPERKQSEKKKKDSLEDVNLMKIAAKSKLFLWERASEFLYSKKFGEKVNILDNRVSGLQQPVYEMLALRSNRNRIPREIREENHSLYRYYLTDSIQIDGRENYVIRFRMINNKVMPKRRKFNGYIYVDAENYALRKIESSSNKKNEGSITSNWKLFNGKWFLDKENFKVRMGMTYLDEKYQKDEKTGEKIENKNRERFGNYIFMTTDYFDFKSPIEEKKRDFEGYSMSVKNFDGSLIHKFRTDSLTTREQSTYVKIDSVGKKYKLDQKLSTITGLMSGYFRFGMFDFDALEILNYNGYEGFRLGLALKLNAKFSKYISPDFRFAYGLKDKAWKYTAGIDVRTTLERNSFFRFEHYHDVMASGRFNETLWNFKMITMNAGVDLNNDKFYGYQGFKLSYQRDIGNPLTLISSFKYDKEDALFDYGFKDFGKSFNNFAGQLTLKYSPKSKNIMTPNGKYVYEQNYPEYFLNFEQGLKVFGGDLKYSRLDFLTQHQFKTKIGVTGVRTYAGITLGEAPIWHHFAISGLGNLEKDLNFNFTSYLGFATMEGGKYYDDKFFGYYFTHRIPWYFRTVGKNTSSFDLAYKGIIGDIKNPGFHQFEFQKLNHLYQEVGMEWNNFLGSQFNLGFFYRIGYYSTPKFSENFAIQLKLSFLGF